MQVDGGGSADVLAVRSGRFTISRLHRTGGTPARVLVVGSRFLLGAADPPGAVAAFSSRLADRLWLRLRRGLDMDVLWELRPVLEAIRGGAASWRLWRYDVVVLVEAARPGPATDLRRRGVARVLRAALPALAAAGPVLVVREGRFDELPATIDGVTEVVGRGTPAANLDLLTEELDRLLTTSDAVEWREAADEGERQSALDALELPSRPVSQRLLRVVEVARDALGTPFAQITMVDREELWALASAGMGPTGHGRANTLCDLAISRREPTVVPDLLEVYPMERLPLLPDGRPVRFFAAYPIESLEGYRVGVLCVFDAVPRPAEEVDVVALRDLALLAEAEIIEDRRDATRPD